MSQQQPTHHAIDYIELTVSDIANAKRFYEVALGWRFNDYGPTYAGIQGKHREQGGLTLGDPNPGGPLVIIYSENLEQSLEAVRQAGATVVKEIFTFPGGRRFHFADPSGNELAVWSDG